MTLKELTSQVADFHGLSHNDKIKLFAWQLHSFACRERFNQKDIRVAYESINCEQPSSIGPYLAALERRKPKGLLKDSKGYYLPQRTRDQLSAKYGQREITIQVHRLLSELPGKITLLAQRQFLDEALTCFRHGAFRAAIVMTWNLGFDHLINYILTRHLAAFNAAVTVRYPKKTGLVLKVKDDFEDLKESETIEIAKTANILVGNVAKVLAEKLTKRNMAAHPSNIGIAQLQAEDFISDIVTNVVLKLA